MDLTRAFCISWLVQRMMAAVVQLSDKDLAHEEDLLRDPYNLKNWWHYLDFKSEAPARVRNVIFERAVAKLPGSYKLWMRYLTERIVQVRDRPVTDPAYDEVNNAFDRALVQLHKFPKLWVLFLTFLTKQKLVTRTRRTFDNALKALPITMHVKWIWPLYIKFARRCGVPETAVRIWRRYLMINPNDVEELIKYLQSVGRYDEAAVQLAKVVNDDNFVSQEGRSKHDLWNSLLKVVTTHPQAIKSLDVDAIIRSGIRRFAHEIGNLWVALADYYVRCGHFEKARDVYEEGITSVQTVRDFGVIFDAYTQCEESLLSARMAMATEAAAAADAKAAEAKAPAKKGKKKGAAAAAAAEAEAAAPAAAAAAAAEEDSSEIDLRVARLEDLLSRRPLLVNSVLLRQNPHNVTEWLKRIDLFQKQADADAKAAAEAGPDADDNADVWNDKIARAYTEAVTTVDPQKATGKPHQLWVGFAKFYESNSGLAEARQIFEKGVLASYKSTDHLATLWCEYAEMELRNKNYTLALAVMRKATTVPPRAAVRGWRKDDDGQVGPVQDRLFRSTKLWAFYADLEENLGSVDSTKGVYEQMITLRVITPQQIVNYAHYMEENKFFEESFRVYEKGVAMFEYPHVLPVWLAYLKKFIERYEGKKMERTRDLFEQAVEKIPPKEAKKVYLLYAAFEEKYGLARRAMAVYDKACERVAPEDRRELYSIYIDRATERFGVTKTREIYEKAIQNLPDKHLKGMLLRYAELERKLGEIDRARHLFSYGSQYTDPRLDADYWKAWHDFEVAHGNEDTFRDMLRLRRSVQAISAQTSVMAAAAAAMPDALNAPSVKPSPMATLEAAAAAAAAAADRSADSKAKQFRAAELTALADKLAAAKRNTEEIELDIANAGAMPHGMKAFEDPHAPHKVDDSHDIEEQALPVGVFGSLAGAPAADSRPAAAAAAAATEPEAAVGAKARFANKRKADS